METDSLPRIYIKNSHRDTKLLYMINSYWKDKVCSWVFVDSTNMRGLRGLQLAYDKYAHEAIEYIPINSIPNQMGGNIVQKADFARMVGLIDNTPDYVIIDKWREDREIDVSGYLDLLNQRDEARPA